MFCHCDMRGESTLSANLIKYTISSRLIQQVKKKTDCLLNNGEVLSRATQLAERAAFISQVA